MPESPPAAAEAILGIDNIALELPIAGVGSRVLAAVLDLVVLFILEIAAFLGTVVLMAVFETAGWWVAVVLLAVVFLLQWGYFAVLEVATRGRTLGKMAVGLRVVGASGGMPSIGSLLARNLIRTVDFLVGIPLMAADPLARRLGDRVAGTLVVHDRKAAAELILGRTPRGWGARRIGLVESYLRRSPALDPERSRHLAGRLLELVDRDAPGFLDEVRSYSDPELALRRAFDAREVV